jgi:Na+/H+-dicarboxylate symporter
LQEKRYDFRLAAKIVPEIIPMLIVPVVIVSVVIGQRRRGHPARLPRQAVGHQK